MRTSFADGASKLLEWVKREAELSLPEGKISKRSHLLHVRKTYEKKGFTVEQLDEKFPELVEVEVPPSLNYLKSIFMDLNLTRQSGFNGPMAFTYTEMLAYSQLKDEQLSPQDVEIIKRMDFAYLEVVHEHLAKEQPKG